ncbi:DUF1454 family protein [Serratia odorifera]|uniref:DUF1454 family protein n=2 Tax=Serratia odorifera TaxID=618 RepID=D4DZ30_SEROD|nr:DUF1454 family protein [Serratia odorifera]EFE97088.1 hypothetical protein HMPREF0758_1180 [Serratia odorifera DSM 4582]MBJ2066931.1 DUF1454 family protein [Serratia odorifera]PNK91692.1 DUF1454 domain-containing protein [Serratia odorifera]RII72724.1 DUF1454 family protein [Serratia odorifera]VDZ54816.1 Protein of uncharacterised function (DUF1454) [Serratia odorifera]
MLRKITLIACLAYGMGAAWADPPAAADAPPTAPYLLAGAPTFDLTVVKFREKYNRDNPTLPIGEFRAIAASEDDTPLLTRAASKLNENLYASTALEKGTGKIKTLQITHLPLQGNDAKTARAIAVNYMAALMRQFEPALSVEQSIIKVNSLLEKGKGSHFYSQQVGAIRYVVADNGDQGLTFAVEPVKLTLAEP